MQRMGFCSKGPFYFCVDSKYRERKIGYGGMPKGTICVYGSLVIILTLESCILRFFIFPVYFTLAKWDEIRVTNNT